MDSTTVLYCIELNVVHVLSVYTSDVITNNIVGRSRLQLWVENVRHVLPDFRLNQIFIMRPLYLNSLSRSV